jgi:hypothetical protein
MLSVFLAASAQGSHWLSLVSLLMCAAASLTHKVQVQQNGCGVQWLSLAFL